MDDNYSPRFLQRQSSCSCAPSISRSSRGFVRGGFDIVDDDDDFFAAAAYGGHHSSRPSAGRSCSSKLRGLWRKIMREKKRILLCGVAPACCEQYDAQSYAQNFDDGAAWVEPENLSRSFSARFAVPSRVLQRVAA